MRPRLPLFALLALVVLAVSAGEVSAWTMEAGVSLHDGPTTLITNVPVQLSEFSFENGTEAPMFNGSLVLDLQPDDGVSPYVWQIERLDLTTHIIVNATTTVNGTFRINGLTGTTWSVTGVAGTPVFIINAPGDNFTVPIGVNYIEIEPFGGGLPAGATMDLQASFNGDGSKVHASVYLSTSTSGITGQTVTFALYDENNVLVLSGIMDEIGGGAYSKSFDMPTPAQDGETFLGVANVLGSNLRDTVLLTFQAGFQGMIETALDPYLGFLIWGLLLGFFLWRTAWFPAVGAFVGLLDSQLSYVVLGLVGNIVFTTVLFVIYVMVLNGFMPRPWRSRSDKGT